MSDTASTLSSLRASMSRTMDKEEFRLKSKFCVLQEKKKKKRERVCMCVKRNDEW